MPRTTLQRSCRSAVVLAAASSLLLAGAPAASAQAAPTSDVVGATAATALRLTLNLPGGAATRVQLTIDPVTGTVSRTTSATAATADATVLAGSLGTQGLDSGTSSASLPDQLEDSSNPAGAIADGLEGTPLENLLRIELLPSAASVSAAPTSSSEAAVANLGAGLPDALAGALAPLTGPLQAAVDTLLTTLATQAEMPVAQLCGGLTSAVEALQPATGAIETALNPVPIVGSIPVGELLDVTVLGAVCGLATTLDQLNTALQDALSSLTGDSGVLGTGLIAAEQTITSEGSQVTAIASASIAGLTLLGQTPFASATVLETTSTARTSGTAGSAVATVDSTVADFQGGTIDPFLQVRTTINGIRDSFVGEGDLPTELETVLDALFDGLNAALAPVGVTLAKLDDSADAVTLAGCPAELDGTQTGTLAVADGSCAAAATRGVGISVTLPAALAGPLMIGGPLVELQIVPSAAVVQAQPRVAPVAQPPAPTTLPRTGGELPLAAFGLLLGAGVLARRRTRAS